LSKKLSGERREESGVVVERGKWKVESGELSIVHA